MPRVTVFVGNYGSGKTELALSKAFSLAREGRRVALADLDIVNPYFRSRDRVDVLEAAGIQVVIPDRDIAFSDAPVLPAEVGGVLRDPYGEVICDVGGDPTGARVLGCFAEDLATGADLLLVVNAFRPMTQTVGQIVAMAREIEAASGIRLTGLINNSNLAGETTPEVVMEGHRTVRAAAEALGLPIKFVTVRADLAPRVFQLGPGAEVWPIHLHLPLGWA